MSNLEQINDHIIQAENHLISQYKNKTNIDNVIVIFGQQIQELEDMFFDLLLERYLATAIGEQLDMLGDLLNQDRLGLSDDNYRVLLYNKIAEYNSEGAIEDIISIFKIVSGSERVELSELGIAAFALTGFNANPITDTSLIVNSVENAKAAGVKVDHIILTTDIPFGFEETSDALGFGDGEFSELIYAPAEFVFLGSILTFAGGFGVGGLL